MKSETQTQYAHDPQSGLWGKSQLIIREVEGKITFTSTFQICNQKQNLGGGRVCFLPWHPPEGLK